MSNLIFIKDNDNNVGIGSNMINDIKGNINITKNLNVSGNVNINNNLNTEGIVSIGTNISHFSSKVTIKQGQGLGIDLNFRKRGQCRSINNSKKTHC